MENLTSEELQGLWDTSDKANERLLNELIAAHKRIHHLENVLRRKNARIKWYQSIEVFVAFKRLTIENQELRRRINSLIRMIGVNERREKSTEIENVKEARQWTG